MKWKTNIDKMLNNKKYKISAKYAGADDFDYPTNITSLTQKIAKHVEVDFKFLVIGKILLYW